MAMLGVTTSRRMAKTKFIYAENLSWVLGDEPPPRWWVQGKWIDMQKQMMRDVEGWDEYFIRMARFVATRSKDGSKQVGAVVVDPVSRVILSTGFNGFPRGVRESEELWSRPAKYDRVVHAETNAIIAAARSGVSLMGATMYLGCMPCHDCANDIIQSGISLVMAQTFNEHNPFTDDSRWAKSIQDGQAILKEAGVECVFIDVPPKEMIL